MVGSKTPTRILLAINCTAQVSGKTVPMYGLEQISWWKVWLMVFKWIET